MSTLGVVAAFEAGDHPARKGPFRSAPTMPTKSGTPGPARLQASISQRLHSSLQAITPAGMGRVSGHEAAEHGPAARFIVSAENLRKSISKGIEVSRAHNAVAIACQPRTSHWNDPRRCGRLQRRLRRDTARPRGQQDTFRTLAEETRGIMGLPIHATWKRQVRQIFLMSCSCRMPASGAWLK